MPGKLKVKIVAAQDLPVMDRASELTDAFVEIKFGNTTYKTDVYRKSLNPQWNSEWFRFEVDDEDLQDEPLQIRVLDHDTYSAHDAIGKVYIDLDPLLSKENTSVFSGWFPIYDTMHGIRGNLNIIVKVDLFTDFNKFRQSSCGVKFFCTSRVPEGHLVQAILGFVEELVVNDDPEYQWIDKIRSMRASNEARQVQFSKLSGQLQRKIGLKVLELGGNSVIGYQQYFDLEGESGIVVRAIGTAVRLARLFQPLPSPPLASPGQECLSAPDQGVRSRTSSGCLTAPSACTPPVSPLSGSVCRYPLTSRLSSHRASVPCIAVTTATPSPSCHSPFVGSSFVLPEDGIVANSSPTTTAVHCTKLSSSPIKTAMPLVRRSSDSDIDLPPKGGSLSGSSGSGNAPIKPPMLRAAVPQQQSIEMLEYPFFTFDLFPAGFVVHLGGVVSARSVKLLDRIHNPDEPETRDTWWMELRTEIRSHARAMGCHAVVGYRERTTICDEIIVLSACGTAAAVNLQMAPPKTSTLLTASLDRTMFDKEQLTVKKEKHKLFVDINLANQASRSHFTTATADGVNIEDARPRINCRLSHIPYKENSLPFPVQLSKCAICQRSKVPDILFTTIERPPELPVIGKGCFIQARLCRPKKETHGETNAKEISDALPFMEYELHSQLISKLKLKGMNSLFGLQVHITVGECMIVAVATATAVYLASLPPPPLPKVLAKDDKSDVSNNHLLKLNKRITEVVAKNKERYGIHPPEQLSMLFESSPRGQQTDDSDEEPVSELELSAGNKDTFVLEVDDAEDVELVSTLIDPLPPVGFDVCNTEMMPGVPHVVCNLQMFSQVWRGRLGSVSNRSFSQVCDNIIRSLFFKLRAMTPCCLNHLSFDVDLPENDEIQVSLTGMCLGVGEPPITVPSTVPITGHQQDTHRQGRGEELLFHMELHTDSAAPGHTKDQLTPQQFSRNYQMCSSSFANRVFLFQNEQRYCTGVLLTPLSSIPGGHIQNYLGHFNFFIIRESTSVREEGGLNGFMHCFLAEVMAICRAHVAALGGNALVAYQMTECILDESLHKNQSQCLVNVCGDVVHVIYDAGLSQAPSSDAVDSNLHPAGRRRVSPLRVLCHLTGTS
ncbi:hypothetical protein NP493_746g01027 [Ridgeia piscesae]|uniref:C2 domain-containing protein n=1 Tax=Ridgeia piscesae TaxID=27915 RepID=A0AAD9NNR6_RIDPI|nr:hypothetical protein NP493_746g01027 [Ridgeia piscesae]